MHVTTKGNSRRWRPSCTRWSSTPLDDGYALQELALEYLNEYIIHWPIAGNEGDVVEPSIKVSCSL